MMNEKPNWFTWTMLFFAIFFGMWSSHLLPERWWERLLIAAFFLSLALYSFMSGFDFGWYLNTEGKTELDLKDAIIAGLNEANARLADKLANEQSLHEAAKKKSLDRYQQLFEIQLELTNLNDRIKL